MTKSTERFDADRPLKSVEQDRLGYTAFSKQLADSLVKMSPVDGAVVALYGPWGSGKSTLLNFFIEQIKTLPHSEQPVIVDFNPWWFSGRHDLANHFFSQLGGAIGIIAEKKVAKQSAKFLKVFSKSSSRFSTALSLFSFLFGFERSLSEKKEKIENILRKQSRKILVVMDDIDRLSGDEMREIFWLVKAVGNFPNTIYLLAFEKSVVVNALTKLQEIPDEEYLEKIVQVSFELPLPDKNRLRNMFFSSINELTADVPDNEADSVYFGNIFYSGVDTFLHTPRDVKRLINTLCITYPAVHGEVNPVDFIAIETLRIFCAPIYDFVRRNKERFAGVQEQNLHQRTEEAAAFYDAAFDILPNQQTVNIKAMLKRLFPRLEGVWGNTFYGDDFLQEWRKKQRVCSQDHFEIYFRFTLPSDAISNTEIKALLSLANDSNAFGNLLISFSEQILPGGGTRLNGILTKLRDYTDTEIPVDNIRPIITGLFLVGDQLLSADPGPTQMFDLGSYSIRAGRIIWSLLSRLSRDERFGILREAIDLSESVSMIANEVSTLAQEHGKHGNETPDPESDRLVDATQLEILENIALRKIRIAAEEGRLLETPKLPMVLYRWRDWAGDDEPSEWVSQIVQSDEALAVVLDQFLGKTFSHTMGDTTSRTIWRLSPETLEPFMDIASLISRVGALATNEGLTERQRIAINQLLKEYEAREKGEDLDDVLD